MNGKQRLGLIMISCLLMVLPQTTCAAPLMAAPQGLSILQLKMTGDEFIVLQNNGSAAINNLNNYWITSYNNVNPTANGISSSNQQLPAATLQVGEMLLLSAEPRPTCGAAIAGDLSISLSDSSGFMQLSYYGQQAGGPVTTQAGDFVSWSSGINGIIQNVPSNTKNPRALFYRTSSGGSFAWQQADLDNADGCQLNVVVAGGSGSSSAVTPLTLAATSPSATILGTVTEQTEAGIVSSANNIGLLAPQLSELLPNPVGTGNDATDEFIELYNPNNRIFDLSGFSLEAGATRLKSYTFPTGTTLEPSSFRTFLPTDTKLTLSNSSGQVNLVDPNGTVISATAVYNKAKDGHSWAVAKSSWSYTTQPTPGKSNVIVQPAVKTKATTKSKKKPGRTVSQSQRLTGSKGAASVAGPIEEEAGVITIHSWMLALVAVAALLYGAYEYRRDIANRMHRLGTKLGRGRTNRSKTTRSRNDRTRE